MIDFAEIFVSFNVQEYVGAVGNAASAYLQTKGMIDQAKIISEFKEVLTWIAALGWLFAIAMAIGSVAVFGNYRQGLYLLIGPALFYWMIEAKAQTDGTVFRVGDRVISGHQAEQTEFLRHIRAITDDDGSSGTREVSFFFAVYDSVISEMTQMVVSVLIDTANNQDLRFYARERMLNYLLNSTTEDPGLLRLVGAINFGECAHLVTAQQRAVAGQQEAQFRLRENDDIEYTTEQHEIEWTRPRVELDPMTKRFLILMKNTGAQEYQNVRISQPEDDFTPKPSCQDVWLWIKAAMQRLAEQRIDERKFKGLSNLPDSTQIPWQEVIRDAIAWLSGQGNNPSGSVSAQEQKARDVLAAFIYKNTLQNGSLAALNAQAFSHTPFDAQEYELVFGPMQEAESHGGFMKLRYFAGAVPYIQGMLLYLLSVAFPFFAVLLVVPGRAMSFLTWCSLWAWVKSWDVGFAFVNVGRDIYWYFLNDRVNVFGKELDWSDPMVVMGLIFNNDPFEGENLYWMIVSTLTLSVPLLTAHLIMGATGLYDMFKHGIDQTAGRFGKIELGRAKRRVGNMVERQIDEDNYRLQMAFARHAQNLPPGPMNPGGGGGGPGGGAGAGAGAGANGNPNVAVSQDGRGIPAFGGARARYTAEAHAAALFLGTSGTPQFLAKMQAEQVASPGGSAPSFMRGLPRLDAAVSAEDLNFIYRGDQSKIASLRTGGGPITWADVFAERSYNNQQNEATLTGAVGRRMFGVTRSAGQIKDSVQLSYETARFMRGVLSDSNLSYVHGARELSEFLTRGEATMPGPMNPLTPMDPHSPGLESGAGTNPFGTRGGTKGDVP